VEEVHARGKNFGSRRWCRPHQNFRPQFSNDRASCRPCLPPRTASPYRPRPAPVYRFAPVVILITSILLASLGCLSFLLLMQGSITTCSFVPSVGIYEPKFSSSPREKVHECIQQKYRQCFYWHKSTLSYT
jgi:hypothetical protein